MSWATAVAFVCKYYGMGLAEVMDLTIPQFTGLIEQVGPVQEILTGERQQKPIEGKRAAEMLKRIFGVKKKKDGGKR